MIGRRHVACNDTLRGPSGRGVSGGGGGGGGGSGGGSWLPPLKGGIDAPGETLL